jgi:hypothetical protein
MLVGDTRLATPFGVYGMYVQRSNVMMMDRTMERCRKFFGIQHGLGGGNSLFSTDRLSSQARPPFSFQGKSADYLLVPGTSQLQHAAWSESAHGIDASLEPPRKKTIKLCTCEILPPGKYLGTGRK